MYHIFILLRKKSENKGFILLKSMQKSHGHNPQLSNVSFLLPIYQPCCCRNSYAGSSIQSPLMQFSLASEGGIAAFYRVIQKHAFHENTAAKTRLGSAAVFLLRLLCILVTAQYGFEWVSSSDLRNRHGLSAPARRSAISPEDHFRFPSLPLQH